MGGRDKPGHDDGEGEDGRARPLADPHDTGVEALGGMSSNRAQPAG